MMWSIQSKVISFLLASANNPNFLGIGFASASEPDSTISSVPTTTAIVTTVNYTDEYDGMPLMGYLAVPSYLSDDGSIDSNSSNPAAVPGVIILPNWDGVNEYERTRAAMFASLNSIPNEVDAFDASGGMYGDYGGEYVALAADIFGNPDDPEQHQPSDFAARGALTTLYRENITLAAARIEAAIAVLQGLPYVDPTKIGLVGYCFGGSLALNYALSGNDADGSVRASIAFHGGLNSVTENAGNTTGTDYSDNTTVPPTILPHVLLLSGGEDSQDSTASVMFVEEALNRGNATWQLTRYSHVEHGFTGFDSEAYDPYVDMRSHDSAYRFLAEAFDTRDLEVELDDMKPPSFDDVKVTPVDYQDAEGFPLTGFVSHPDETLFGNHKPYPAVILIHDASGPDSYEQTRAQMLADLGYVGFAADIFGSQEVHGYNMTNRTELFLHLDSIRSNTTLFVQRMNAAIETVQAMEHVDSSNIAMMGYCFGGTGVINYALTGEPDTSGNSGVKGVVSFHGGLSSRENVTNATQIRVRMLIESGGEDDTASSIEDLEGAMVEGEAPTWEYTRFSGVEHSFTNWEDDRGRYNLRADVRSWEDAMSFLKDVFGEEVVVDADNHTEPGADAGNDTEPGADAGVGETDGETSTDGEEEAVFLDDDGQPTGAEESKEDTDVEPDAVLGDPSGAMRFYMSWVVIATSSVVIYGVL